MHISQVLATRRHTCRWLHCGTSARPCIASADSHAPSSDRRTHTRSYAASRADMTCSSRTLSCRLQHSCSTFLFQCCGTFRDRCTCCHSSSQLKTKPPKCNNFKRVCKKTNCKFETSITNCVPTEFAVVAGVASRAHARQLISRALLIVQTLCDVTDACRTGASVSVHQPARVTLAPEFCRVT